MLFFYESNDKDALLEGELRLATLNDDYTALSYVWDDWYNRCPIRLNDFDTSFIANLAIALRRLRTEKKAVKIWIDAISINQTDSIEKSHQVQLMADIYRHANIRTIVWLGEEGNYSNEAMQFVSIVNGTEKFPEVPVYAGDDMEEAAELREARFETTKSACLWWEQHVKRSIQPAIPNPTVATRKRFAEP